MFRRAYLVSKRKVPSTDDSPKKEKKKPFGNSVQGVNKRGRKVEEIK